MLELYFVYNGHCKFYLGTMVGVTYQEIHLFVEFLKEQYGQGRPDYIEALNDLDGLVEVSYREAIERFLEDEL
ncbi:hypothetical protein OLG72_09730 [Streptococcus pneumoniae]|nr:hypothetical protein [Streptococcus pneumoniae]MDG9548502.1 hypothetical protein [Streptococcus pneumoniae]VTE93737.1 phage protein [Streptococcus pneumoniae]HEW2715778.1 hypothetical protein [Streptococcus pneumoniae]